MPDPLRDAAQTFLDRIDALPALDVPDGLAVPSVALRAALAAADTAPEPKPCSECATDPRVCAHLVASKGMAGCCGPCSLGDTHQAMGRPCAAADGTTPTQPDEVLYDGPTDPIPVAGTDKTMDHWSAISTSKVGAQVFAAPGTRVRVVATPATEGAHG